MHNLPLNRLLSAIHRRPLWWRKRLNRYTAVGTTNHNHFRVWSNMLKKRTARFQGMVPRCQWSVILKLFQFERRTLPCPSTLGVRDLAWASISFDCKVSREVVILVHERYPPVIKHEHWQSPIDRWFSHYNLYLFLGDVQLPHLFDCRMVGQFLHTEVLQCADYQTAAARCCADYRSFAGGIGIDRDRVGRALRELFGWFLMACFGNQAAHL